MQLFFVAVVFFAGQLKASLVDDAELLLNARLALQEHISPEGISLKELESALKPVKMVLHKNPEKIVSFNVGLGAQLWSAALLSEKALTKKGVFFDVLTLLEGNFLPDCPTLKKFETDAEGIASVREIDQKSIEDALLVKLSGVGFLDEQASYFLSGVQAGERALAKKRLRIFFEALKKCADFFKNDSLYSEHPKFAQNIRTLLSSVFLSGDRDLIVDVQALQIPEKSYPFEALADKEVAAKLFDITTLKGRHVGHETPFILEMIRFNIKSLANKFPQLKAQRAWIKEELKNFTYDSFPWYDREILDDGNTRERNILDLIVVHEDAEMLEMLPLKPGAQILKERAYYDFKPGAAESFRHGKSLYGNARSIEWIKKLRALGVEGDISDAGEWATPVLLEDLALGLALLKQ